MTRLRSEGRDRHVMSIQSPKKGGGKRLIDGLDEICGAQYINAARGINGLRDNAHFGETGTIKPLGNATIHAGTEILMAYGADYWRGVASHAPTAAHDLPQPQTCDARQRQSTEHDGAEQRPPARPKRPRQSTDDDTTRPPPPPPHDDQPALPPLPAQHPCTAPAPPPCAHAPAEPATITTSTEAGGTPQGSAPHAPPPTHHAHPPLVADDHWQQPAHAAQRKRSHGTRLQSEETVDAPDALQSLKRARSRPPRATTSQPPTSAATMRGDASPDHATRRRPRDPGKASNAEEKRRRT